MGSNVEIGFTVLVTAIVLAVVLAIRGVMERRRAEASRRLSDDDSALSLPALRVEEATGPMARIDKWFDTAVSRSGMEASPAGVVAVMLLVATVLGFGLYYWKEQMWLAALGILVGVGGPLLVVALLQNRFRNKLQSLLPDAYRMLAGSVRAGQSLEQAIEFYSTQGNKPLSDEFAFCAGQLKLGMNPVSALKATAERVRLMDFDLLVSTVGLYYQTGGNLALLLERLADSVRDRNLYRGQFVAATAQSRIVAVALGIAAPTILLAYALLEPDHVMPFFRSTTGWMILGGCALLELIGMIWIWNLLKVDY